MTRLVAISFCLMLSLFTPSDVTGSEPLRVMSFNLRYGKANDGDNRWEKRDWLVAKTVKAFDPDLLGTQETLKFQAEFLEQQLEGYTYFGRSRMKTPNEHCGIFFRTNRFTQLAGGHFWLSETPSVPESKSWDSALPRMATWVLLHDKSNETSGPILFLNTHFDHKGVQAREKSAGLTAQQVNKLQAIAADATVVVTGDFNTPEGSAPYRALVADNDMLTDTYRVAHPDRASQEGTFNGFIGKSDGPRIDWILTSAGLSVDSADIDRSSESGRYPSDHFPVTAVLSIDE